MTYFENIRSQVPALSAKVKGKDLVYLDNAATAQRPESVIRLFDRCCLEANANIHRAVHTLSAEATRLYEEGRRAVAEFINAPCRECVVFTSGTTASVNLVANSMARGGMLGKGDVVLLSEAEHHSNLVPWQMAAQFTGARIEYVPVDDSGRLRMDVLDALLAKGGVKLLALAHISNVLGIVNPIAEVTAKAHKVGALVLIDGAQGIVHEKVDVQEIDCDFYVFSGHKVYTVPGTGILYGKPEILEALPPFMGGGDMVETVSYGGFSATALPLKFEAGTPNFAAVATYVPALEFARSLEGNQVKTYMKGMTDYLFDELGKLGGCRIYGSNGEDKAPLISFVTEGAHHADIAQLLDAQGVAVRSGLMCAEPLITERFGQSGMLRVSLAPYNTPEECQKFIKALEKALAMLR